MSINFHLHRMCAELSPSLSPCIPIGGVRALRKIVLNKVCLTIFNKRHEYFLTLAKQQRWFPLHIPGSAEQITKESFQTHSTSSPSFGRMTFPSRDFSHIKHSVTLNKCIKTVRLFKEACAYAAFFPTARAPSLCSLLCSLLWRALRRPFRMSFWCVLINTSSSVSGIIKCTCQWRVCQSWYFKVRVQPSPEIQSVQWPQSSLTSVA